ncbi:heavy-metal-associated domain-containing protein [Testudinibacter sp. P27/CKL/0425]
MKKIVTLMMLWAAFSGFATAAETANTSGERQLTLQVNEMNCQLCAYLVNKELRNLDGVVSTKPNIKTQLVKVVVKEPFDNQRLIQAMDGLHYTAAVLPAE